ncbi:MAG: molecular chaperone DnaK (HSP70), partial [Oleispira sp.]
MLRAKYPINLCDLFHRDFYMIGFDYGSSNCAVGVMENNKPKLLS